MVQEQVFLKEGGAGTSTVNVFKVYYFYIHSEITLPFAELCYAFEEKKNFSTTIVSW